MKITQVYKYKLNGVVYVGALNVPEDATILETMDILSSKDGYVLVRKSDSVIIGTSIWLKDGDTKNNYNEIKDPIHENQHGTEE